MLNFNKSLSKHALIGTVYLISSYLTLSQFKLNPNIVIIYFCAQIRSQHHVQEQNKTLQSQIDSLQRKQSQHDEYIQSLQTQLIESNTNNDPIIPETLSTAVNNEDEITLIQSDDEQNEDINMNDDEEQHLDDKNEEIHFYEGFGVNTEPTESQAMFGMNMTQIQDDNAINNQSEAMQYNEANQVENINAMNDIYQCPTQKMQQSQSQNNNVSQSIMTQNENEIDRDLPTQIIPEQSQKNGSNDKQKIIMNASQINEYAQTQNENKEKCEKMQSGKKRKCKEEIIKSPRHKRIKLDSFSATIPETQINFEQKLKIKKRKLSLDDSHKISQHFRSRHNEIKQEYQRMTKHKLWNDECAKEKYLSMFEKYIEQSQKSIDKLTKNKANKADIATIYFLHAYTMHSYCRNQSRFAIDSVVEKYAIKGIEFDARNFWGYNILAHLRFKTKRYSEAIASFQQCLELCNDAKKRAFFEKQIKEV